MTTQSERLAELEEFRANTEMVLLELSKRDQRIEDLTRAVARLKASSDNLNETLRVAGDAQVAALEAKVQIAQAETARAKSEKGLLESLAGSEHRYRWHTRIMAGAALLVALAGDVIGLSLVIHKFNGIIHDQAVIRYDACQARNMQAADGQNYQQRAQEWSNGLFAWIAKRDPDLGKIITSYVQSHPRPDPPPAPSVPCVRP